jgi:hypothetical protein
MIATVKQVYPIVVVFAIFAALVAATIALRLAIWLPSTIATKRVSGKQSNHSS